MVRFYPAYSTTQREMTSIQTFTKESGLKPVPGFGLPIHGLPNEHFPVLTGDEDLDWKAKTLVIREVCMLKFIEDITNKPDWWLKVNDPDIEAKWKAEALTVDWGSFVKHGDFTENMADYCMHELREKADLYQKTGLIPVIDYSACVVKSDSLIPDDLKDELLQGIKPLEDVPDHCKDWHPGSDGKVLDLVHPSLWPLVYGRSHVLTDRRIGISDAMDYCGAGIRIPVPRLYDEEDDSGPMNSADFPSVSVNFQWLPCDIALSKADGTATIESYINNLHPVEHAGLYPVIERFVQRALPAWDLMYRWPEEFATQRLKTMQVGVERSSDDTCEYSCRPYNRPLDEGEPERDEYEMENDDYEESERGKKDHEWFSRTHPPILPDMELPHPSIRVKPSDVKATGFFGDASRIQVIVKLANIHLTPEKPSYDGGSWHVEGQLNEHICSTALFYYDADNITDCTLDFRTPANDEDMMMELNYEQDDHHSIQRTFNIDSHSHTLQDVGSVLTRPGRALFFPNLFQHHVSPFRLADASRPGHRKILALFLVDPAIPVLSTANVPPQQQHWWSRATGLDGRGAGRLPPELTEIVVENLDFLMDEQEAKVVRDKLMAERTVLQTEMDGNLHNVEWSFCEH